MYTPSPTLTGFSFIRVNCDINTFDGRHVEGDVTGGGVVYTTTIAKQNLILILVMIKRLRMV